MIIAPVKKADYPALKKIVSICIPLMDEVPAAEKVRLHKLILENMKANLELKGNVYLKAVLANEIIGFILIKGHEKISELFVLPQYRRLGAGSALLTQALAEATSKSNGDHIWLNAALHAVPFYHRHGFVDFETDEEKFSFVKKLRYDFPASKN